MLLLGLDIGTSSVKASVVDANTQQCICTVQYPETEAPIISERAGWAEQSPADWWAHTQSAILQLNTLGKYNPKDIAAIGIAYQMHGLVMLDKEQKVLRNSIIWCDSRAVEIGERVFREMGKLKCLSGLLNSPGNFTASKLAWVKENEPEVFERIDKIMLPGDFISMKLTGNCSTTIAGLSEGIFWDFSKNELSQDVFSYFGFSASMIPRIKPVFGEHGQLEETVAAALSLKPGIPVSYKAGDQPNNALSLNVLEPCEVAATAGTSGVIYAVTDELVSDWYSRVNSFAHVNHTAENIRLGVLMCINGTGALNRWVKMATGNDRSYEELNKAAMCIPAGSDGLSILPFGNGAERILHNRNIGASVNGIDLNKHTRAHIYRATQEGVAFAFRYGFDIMSEKEIRPKVIRAGRANMFLSPVFTDALVNTLKVPVELYDTDGSKGAAIGAGIGAGIYSSARDAFQQQRPISTIEPDPQKNYEDFYLQWSAQLSNN